MKNNIHSLASIPRPSAPAPANSMLQMVGLARPASNLVHPSGSRPLFGDDAVEKKRLEKVEQLDILDTPREEPFDRISRLAQRMFQVPIAVVTIIDGHRSWFKSCIGIEGSEANYPCKKVGAKQNILNMR